MKDTSIRFSLESTAIRGAVAVLEDSSHEALSNSAYTPGVSALLQQFMAAVAAIGSLTRFEGTMTLQARSDQGVNLMMAEHKDGGKLRAIARGHEAATGESLNELLPSGILAITLDPTTGQRYQGVIPLDNNCLSTGLADYFSQSEQLRTSIHMVPTRTGIAAIILQAMPSTELNHCSDEDWAAATMITETLTPEELETLDGNALLYRLFHEFGVRVFEPQSLQYQCGCSKERMQKALSTLNPQELLDIIEQDGKLQLNCDFCNSSHDFYLQDLQNIFVNLPNPKTSSEVKKLH